MLQNIEFTNEFTDNIFIIPIQSLRQPVPDNYSYVKDYNKALLEYNKIKNRDEDFYDLYYFPHIKDDGTIYERVLVLSDARFVHRSMLFKIMNEDGLNEKELREINIRISKMLDIKEIESCKTCKSNCEKCELSYMYKSIKGIMERTEREFNKKNA
ncbi:MAG: hypothetical protein KAX49_00060 [Halanaerobiales bacterium]|nr:hypothetical protein [Halanaerobiales bacterium]